MLAQINWFCCCNFQDCQSDYLNLLSLLDSGFNGLNSDNMVIDSSTDISLLKERVAQYIASECKSGSPRFVEYWVPVQLSNVQLEQYCASLLSNSMILSSCLKSEPADVLRDIIISARKVTPNLTTAHDFCPASPWFLPLSNVVLCNLITLTAIFTMAQLWYVYSWCYLQCCDHPNLLDQSLQSFVTNIEENLDVGIKASGKLKALDKILLEIRNRGLRVLILFQVACLIVLIYIYI